MIVNMIVDLVGADFRDAAKAQELLCAGITLENLRGASDADQRFIQSTFGGSWASEARDGWNWIARRGHDAIGFCSYEQRTHAWWWLKRWIEKPDVGIFGPMGVSPSARGIGIGCALALHALDSLQSMGFAYAIIPAVGPVQFYERCCGARVVERLADPSGVDVPAEKSAD